MQLNFPEEMGGGIFFSCDGDSTSHHCSGFPPAHGTVLGVGTLCLPGSQPRACSGPEEPVPPAPPTPEAEALPDCVCRSAEDVAVNNYEVIIVLFTLVEVKVGCESSCPVTQGDEEGRKCTSKGAMRVTHLMSNSGHFVNSVKSLCSLESFSNL